MWYTSLFHLSPFPTYFPCWTSFVDFLGSVCVSMYGFAEFCVCFGSWFLSFAAVVLLQFLQQRKVSSAKQHEYDESTSSFIPVLANIGFYFHCVHWPVLCVPALPLGCVLSLTASTWFVVFVCSITHFHHPSSCDIQLLASLSPCWLDPCPTTPVASLGIYLSFPFTFSLSRTAQVRWDVMTCSAQDRNPVQGYVLSSHPLPFGKKGNSGSHHI